MMWVFSEMKPLVILIKNDFLCREYLCHRVTISVASSSEEGESLLAGGLSRVYSRNYIYFITASIY